MPRTLVARLWLPDVPGTLGLVAAAIGRAGGDVSGIEILERAPGVAVDELLIEIPDDRSVEDLVNEVAAVAGVDIEDVHEVDSHRVDQSILALEVAAQIAQSPLANRIDVVCSSIRALLEADWCSVIDSESIRARSGTVPDEAWLSAFVGGIGHLSESASLEYTPSDVAWAPLAQQGSYVVCGRKQRAFRRRERQHLVLIARIADSTLVIDPVARPLDGP